MVNSLLSGRSFEKVTFVEPLKVSALSITGTDTVAVEPTEPSTSAHVSHFAGSRMSPETDQEMVVGKLHVTFAIPVAGETPTTWNHDPERGFQPEVTVQSSAPIPMDFGSYAAKASLTAFVIPESLNLSGFIFSFAQSGLPAE